NVAIRRDRPNSVAGVFGEPQVVIRTDRQEAGITVGVWELELGDGTVGKVEAPDTAADETGSAVLLGAPEVSVRADCDYRCPAVRAGQLELRDVSPSVRAEQAKQHDGTG